MAIIFTVLQPTAATYPSACSSYVLYISDPIKCTTKTVFSHSFSFQNPLLYSPGYINIFKTSNIQQTARMYICTFWT